ncbi:MAG: biotin/lipoyl-binding protein, partial [Candidatus Hydrogenedentes bacterium]|nr:biotin/lipoyl-binding protein [Candidatus Hydrogenedentota bacterium]
MGLDKNTLDQLRIDRAAAPRRGPFVFIFAIVLVAVVIGAGVFLWSMSPARAGVRTALAKETVSGAQATLLNSSGYVTARREATVASKVTGKVMEVLVEEGMKVEADQVLARIDSSNVEKGLDLAQAQLRSAREALDETRANIELADRELKRVTELTAQEVTTQADLDRAEAESKSLKQRLERQEADVAVADRE